MTRWRKVRPIALFELLGAVRSKSWLIATFGMPVFLMLYAGLVAIPIYFEVKKEQQVSIIGVVDDAMVLHLDGDASVEPIEIPPEIRTAIEAAGQAEALRAPLAWLRNFAFRPFPSGETARAALVGGAVKAYFVIPADYLATGVVEAYLPEHGLKGSEARRALGKLLAERMLAGKLPDDVAKRIRDPIADSRDFIVTRTGEVKKGEGIARVVRVIVPIGFSVLLLLSIMMSAGGLVQATAIEKENKVVEVLLSSANPDEILVGKLLGLGIAGTLQMTVWFSMTGIAGVGFMGTLAALGVEPPWAGMAAAVLFFPLAYLFYGSLMLGTGSLGANQKEANQWGMTWAILAAGPMILLQLLLDEPHGTLARVLTWIPFTAPTTVILRLTTDPGGIRSWEVAGAIAVMLVSIWFTIRLSARLFRVGIMLTGARPKLREILRQARLT